MTLEQTGIKPTSKGLSVVYSEILPKLGTKEARWLCDLTRPHAGQKLFIIAVTHNLVAETREWLKRNGSLLVEVEILEHIDTPGQYHLSESGKAWLDWREGRVIGTEFAVVLNNQDAEKQLDSRVNFAGGMLVRAAFRYACQENMEECEKFLPIDW